MPIWDATQAAALQEIGRVYDVTQAGALAEIQSVWDVTTAGTSSKLWDATVDTPLFSNGAWQNMSVGGQGYLAGLGIDPIFTIDSAGVYLIARTNYSHGIGNVAGASLGYVDCTPFRKLQFSVDFLSPGWDAANVFTDVQLVRSRNVHTQYVVEYASYVFDDVVAQWRYFHPGGGQSYIATIELDIAGIMGNCYVGFTLKSRYVLNNAVYVHFNNIKLLA